VKRLIIVSSRLSSGKRGLCTGFPRVRPLSIGARHAGITAFHLRAEA